MVERKICETGQMEAEPKAGTLLGEDPQGQGKTMLRCITMDTSHHPDCCHCPFQPELGTLPITHSFFSLTQMPSQGAEQDLHSFKAAYPEIWEKGVRQWLNRRAEPNSCILLTGCAFSNHGERVGGQTVSSSWGQGARPFLSPSHLAYWFLLQDYPVSLADNTDLPFISQWTRGKRAAGEEHLI